MPVVKNSGVGARKLFDRAADQRGDTFATLARTAVVFKSHPALKTSIQHRHPFRCNCRDVGLRDFDLIAAHRSPPYIEARISMREDRKSVGQGKSVSVREDLGGRRIIKKKNKE